MGPLRELREHRSRPASPTSRRPLRPLQLRPWFLQAPLYLSCARIPWNSGYPEATRKCRRSQSPPLAGDRRFVPPASGFYRYRIPLFSFLTYCFPLFDLRTYLDSGCTDNWFTTLSGLPATSMALATIDFTSSSDLTGPFKVTVPSWLMILTLCA